MKTHIFGEHPFPMCSGHQNDPIHKFSCFVPQNNPHFVNSLHYIQNTGWDRIRTFLTARCGTHSDASTRHREHNK